MLSSIANDSSTTSRSSLDSIVRKIARDIDRFLSTGDVAELRRLRPEDPSSPAFWKMIAYRVEPGGVLASDGPKRDLQERRWAVLLAGMAEMKGLHATGRRLGSAVASAGVAESRFVRLLRAHDDGLLDAVRLIAHHLASAGEPVDWADLARLVMSDGDTNEEAVRRGIARDYYGTLSRT